MNHNGITGNSGLWTFQLRLWNNKCRRYYIRIFLVYLQIIIIRDTQYTVSSSITTRITRFDNDLPLSSTSFIGGAPRVLDTQFIRRELEKLSHAAIAASIPVYDNSRLHNAYVRAPRSTCLGRRISKGKKPPLLVVYTRFSRVAAVHTFIYYVCIRERIVTRERDTHLRDKYFKFRVHSPTPRSHTAINGLEMYVRSCDGVRVSWSPLSRAQAYNFPLSLKRRRAQTSQTGLI